MTLKSYGFVPSVSAAEAKSSAQDLLAKLPVLLAHSDTILNCVDYFFCELPFASSSWPFMGGDGPLYLGYLLIGWKLEAFTGECPLCGGFARIHSFAGSPLSGTNKWTGTCVECNDVVKGRWNEFVRRVCFTIDLRKNYPSAIAEWQEYDGVKFSWGGDGLAPERRKRLVTYPVSNPPSFDELIEELEQGRIRPAKPPSISLPELPIALKFGPR